MLVLSYTPQQPSNDYQVFPYTMKCCELHRVSQTNNCKLHLLSYEPIRHVFFVKNLLPKSYKICCLTPESIHAVA